jgi:hypothetical protein
MDTTPYVEAYKTNVQPTQNSAGAVLDLDNIDDILADILTDETLGGDLWDSET